MQTILNMAIHLTQMESINKSPFESRCCHETSSSHENAERGGSGLFGQFLAVYK